MAESYFKIFGDESETVGKGFNFKLPNFKPPKIKPPKFKPPKIKLPNFKPPKIKPPKFKPPKFKAPNIKPPKIKLPNFKAPNIKMPNFKPPRLPNLPQFNGSQMFEGLTTGITDAIQSTGSILTTAMDVASPMLSQFTSMMSPGAAMQQGQGQEQGQPTEEDMAEEQAIDEEIAMLDQESAMLDQELSQDYSSISPTGETNEEMVYGDSLDKGEYGL